MKKSKLEAVLRRKVRIKITRRKRGRFRVTVPIELAGRWEPEYFTTDRNDRPVIVKNFIRKSDALTWLLVKLRCSEPITISVEGTP